MKKMATDVNLEGVSFAQTWLTRKLSSCELEWKQGWQKDGWDSSFLGSVSQRRQEAEQMKARLLPRI